MECIGLGRWLIFHLFLRTGTCADVPMSATNTPKCVKYSKMILSKNTHAFFPEIKVHPGSIKFHMFCHGEITVNTAEDYDTCFGGRPVLTYFCKSIP